VEFPPNNKVIHPKIIKRKRIQQNLILLKQLQSRRQNRTNNKNLTERRTVPLILIWLKFPQK
jgi:hypothetical protein